MKENFQNSLKHLLKHEGGYVDHPKDPGGATNKGITLNVFRLFYGFELTKKDLRNITDKQVEGVYQNYWDECKSDELPSGVDYVVFDQTVNSGLGRSIKLLQASLDVKIDGHIGPRTIAAAQKFSAVQTITTMCILRLRFLQNLKTWDTFGKGWAKRVRDVRKFGLEMAAKS